MGHVQTLAIVLTQRAAKTLTEAVQTTPDSRLTWQPMEQGRSVLEQAIDCALANLKWALILEDRNYCRLPRAFGAVAEISLTTREAALARLRETTDRLVDAIGMVEDDEIARMLAIPSDDGIDLTVAEACLHAYWNMVYHEGQIRYIQTLYQDLSPQLIAPEPMAAA